MHLITQMKPGRKIKLKFIEDFLIFGYNKLIKLGFVTLCMDFFILLDCSSMQTWCWPGMYLSHCVQSCTDSHEALWYVVISGLCIQFLLLLHSLTVFEITLRLDFRSYMSSVVYLCMCDITK